MKAITAEWIDRAEGDLNVAEREWRARKRPNYDALCFHARQCAERYLKARLCEACLKPPRTHDLPSLMNRVGAVESKWISCCQDMTTLAQYSISYLYPGKSATKDDARIAMQALRRFRKEAREAFGIG
jgi:HEPN domain-containing protein